LHSERNIFFFFSFFIGLLFFLFFFLKPPHRSAVLFVLARTQVTSSFSSSSLLASYFSSIYPSTTHYPRTLNKRKRQRSHWYCLFFFPSIKKMNLRRSIITNNQSTITKVGRSSITNMNINHSYKTI
jgi:hypothetical protein